MSSMDLLKFHPLYQPRVWGGDALARVLGRKVPAGDAPMGESWEIVDRADAQSVVAEGPYQGMTLRQVLEENGDAVMGPCFDSSQPFPILVKWLDCAQRLSLQVHPPARIAPELGGEPKTENWYVAHCEEGAGLIAGLARPVSPETFAEALREERLEPLLHRLEVEPGDSMFVPSGRLHAIDAGNLILEIQQNSDTTYRVYDWGRKGLDGQPRTLHVEQAMRCINFDDVAPEILHTDAKMRILAQRPPFRLRKFSLRPGNGKISFGAGQEPRIVSVVEGTIKVVNGGKDARLEQGDNVLLPYDHAFQFQGVTEATILVTDEFTQAAR